MYKYCKECNKEHEKIAFCVQCGSCLYKNGKQVKNQEFPLFKCEKCGKINFWD